MTVIEQTISKFIRTQQSSNVFCYARVDSGRSVTGRANQLFLTSMFTRMQHESVCLMLRAVARKTRRKYFACSQSLQCLAFFCCYTFNSENRIKNYGIFFLCKLPPLIKYATDKVKKEFLSCTNDQVFVFWLRGEKRFSLNRRNQRQDQRRSR